MKFQDILQLPVSKDDVIQAIAKAREQNFFDNLRDRHINIQFDSKLRGYVGEIALKKWFLDNGIKIETTNYFDEEYNMDIDFEYKDLELELKTSLIPDKDKTLLHVFNIEDLKINRRTRKIEDLKGDVHIQIYYDQLTKKKDEWLSEQEIDLDSDDNEFLYDKFLAKEYINKTYLVAWIDKVTLTERMSKLKGYEKSWRFEKRRFWVCKIKECKAPAKLISYLDNR